MAFVLKGSNGLNHPAVQSILEIAEEILSENKVLTTQLLYNIAKKRLNLSRKGLLTIIQFLINKRILVDGSKFTKKSVLSNPYRNNVYRFIKTHLGAHFSLIRKSKVFSDNKSKIGGTGQLIWHLEMLIKFNYVKKVKIKNYTIFIPIEIDDELGILYFFLRDNINMKILSLLLEKDTIKMSNVHKHLKEKREKVYYKLKDLIEHSIISNVEGKSNFLCLNPHKKKLIVEILKKTQKLIE